MIKKISNTTFLAIVACVLWSTAFVGIKIGLKYTAPIQFAGIRFVISGLLILLVIKDIGSYIKLVKKHFKVILWVSLLQTFVQYFFFYMGIERVPGALGAIVIGAGPLFIAIIAHFLMPNDKMNWRKFGSIMLGICGVVLVIVGRGNLSFSNTGYLLGILFLIICNVNSGFSNVLIARNTKNIPPLILSSSSLIIGGVVLFLVSIPMEGMSFQPKATEYYFALLWLSFLSAASISIWTFLLQRPTVKVSDLNMWKFIVPVFGAILAWIMLPNESANLLSIIGMLLTAGSLLMVNYFNRRGVSK